MGDEEIAETALFLKIQQQPDDLGADGDVQRGDRLIADDQLWLGPKGAGEAIVILSDFSGKGGIFNLKPDEKALGLKPGWKVYDFETGKPAGLALTVEPYDFRVVIFKQEEGK